MAGLVAAAAGCDRDAFCGAGSRNSAAHGRGWPRPVATSLPVRIAGAAARGMVPGIDVYAVSALRSTAGSGASTAILPCGTSSCDCTAPAGSGRCVGSSLLLEWLYG